MKHGEINIYGTLRQEGASGYKLPSTPPAADGYLIAGSVNGILYWVTGGGNSIKSIQRGITSIDVTSTGQAYFSTNVTITAVNVDKTVVSVLGRAYRTSYGEYPIYVALTSSTNVKCTTGYQGAAQTDAQSVSWEVIEFN